MLLCILIPTYNRARLAKHVVHMFRSYIDALQLTDEVEIIVQDNGSDAPPKFDDQQGLTVNYLGKNIGADANFVRLFEQSFAEYTWLFGDDDELDCDTFEKIIRELQFSSPDLIFVPRNGFHNDIQVTGIELLERTLVHSTFISSHVVRTRLLDSSKVSNCINNLNYWGMFIGAYEKATAAKIISQTRIAMRTDASGGYAFLETWIREFDSVLHSSNLSWRLKIYLRLDRTLSVTLPFILTLRTKTSNSNFDLNYTNWNFRYLVTLGYICFPISIVKRFDVFRKITKVFFHKFTKKIK